MSSKLERSVVANVGGPLAMWDIANKSAEDEATSRLVLAHVHRLTRAWVLRADRS